MKAMPKPYSLDIRTRVLTKHLNGKTVPEIAIELDVKPTFIYDMLSLYKKTGSVEPKPASGGRKPYLDEEKQQQIAELIQETPDLTLQEIKDALELDISISVLCDTINKKLNLNYKKNAIRHGTE
jgi:transposase